jgi:hypothetical protein
MGLGLPRAGWLSLMGAQFLQILIGKDGVCLTPAFGQGRRARQYLEKSGNFGRIQERGSTWPRQ